MHQVLSLFTITAPALYTAPFYTTFYDVHENILTKYPKKYPNKGHVLYGNKNPVSSDWRR